jgi:hypothetical protein
MKITIDNCMQALFDYASNKYESLAYSKRFECTYPVSGLNNEYAFKQTMSWFIISYKKQDGRTVLEEFIEDSVSEENPELAEQMYKFANPIDGEFVVETTKGNTINLRKEGKVYSVVSYSGNIDIYEPGTRVLCRIIPFKRAYEFWGINMIIPNFDPATGIILNPEYFMAKFKAQRLEQLESIKLHNYSTLHALLNKYPIEWVNGIADSLNLPRVRIRDKKIQEITSLLTDDSVLDVLKSLPENCLNALKLIVSNGGFVKVGILEEKYGYDDTEAFWDGTLPVSVIGILRRKGLLFIGKMPIKTKMYSVAYVPIEIRPAIGKL